MANVNTPFGFRPLKHLTGAPYNGQANIYEIAAGDGTATFVGDLVKVSTQASTDVYQTVQRAGTSGEVTSGLLVGAIVGFLIPTANGTSMVLDTPIYRAASAKRYAYVADSPDLLFEVLDGATVATPQSSIGLNCGFEATAGSTVTGLSNMTTGATAATTTNTLPLTIYGMVSDQSNTMASANQRLIVRINQHQYMGGQTAV